MSDESELEAEDREFIERYGPWRVLEPAELQGLMAGFEKPWWVVGGRAIEAFTGVARPHEDIDLVVFNDHVLQLREHFRGRYHLWSQDGGTMRPLNDRFPELLDPLCQIWFREHALAPWVIDCPVNPSVDGKWQSKRDPGHVADLDEVTFVHVDGIRYLNPEIVLLFKALGNRPKDEADLAQAWPLLSPEKQSWLRDAVLRLYPDHPWTDRLTIT